MVAVERGLLKVAGELAAVKVVEAEDVAAWEQEYVVEVVAEKEEFVAVA